MLSFSKTISKMPSPCRTQARKPLLSALYILLALTTPYMLWKTLILITGSTHPIIVVISQSMAPAFNRGDVLLLWNKQSLISVGEVPVVWFGGRPLPMVHRAIRTVVLDGISQGLLTKGDNNALDDTSMYPIGQPFVTRDEVVGLVKGSIPWLGWLAIWLQENPRALQVGGGVLMLGVAVFT